MCKISHQQCNELSTKWNGMRALVLTLNTFNLFSTKSRFKFRDVPDVQ